MKRSQQLAASLVVAFVASAATSAQALEFSDDMYVAISAGKAIKKHTNLQIDNNTAMTRGGVPVFESSQTSNKNGYKLQLGYKFNENFAVEGGYVNLGKTEYNASYNYKTSIPLIPPSTPGYALLPPALKNITIPTGGASGTASRTAKISGINISAVGSYPITEDISVFAKAGALRAQVKTNSSSVSSKANIAGLGNGSVSKARWRGILGLGADYNFDENFGIRAEFERYNKLGDNDTVGTIDINLMSLGLIGKF